MHWFLSLSNRWSRPPLEVCLSWTRFIQCTMVPTTSDFAGDRKVWSLCSSLNSDCRSELTDNDLEVIISQLYVGQVIQMAKLYYTWPWNTIIGQVFTVWPRVRTWLLISILLCLHISTISCPWSRTLVTPPTSRGSTNASKNSPRRGRWHTWLVIKLLIETIV